MSGERRRKGGCWEERCEGAEGFIENLEGWEDRRSIHIDYIFWIIVRCLFLSYDGKSDLSALDSQPPTILQLPDLALYRPVRIILSAI